MKDVLPYHLFSHENGRYQTVRALGCTATETKQLEQFFFGQTNDAAYLSSLDENPAIILRPIANRFALTRVQLGISDGEGRVTLAFESVLLTTRQASAIVESLGDFVLADWSLQPEGATVSVIEKRDVGQLHADRVSDVLMRLDQGKKIVQPSDKFSLADAAAIAKGIVARSGYSFCYRSLNAQAPVSVNLVALGQSEALMDNVPARSSPNRVIEPRGRETATAPAQFGTMGILAVMFLQAVILLKLFAFPTKPQTDGLMQKQIIDRIEKVNAELASTIKDVRNDVHGAIADFKELTIKQHGINAAKLAQITEGPDGYPTRIDGVRGFFDTQLKALDKIITDEFEAAKFRADAMKVAIEAIKTTIDGLVKKLDQPSIAPPPQGSATPNSVPKR